MNGTGTLEPLSTDGSKSFGHAQRISLDEFANSWSNESDSSQDEGYYVPSTSFSQQMAGLDPSLYQGSGDDFCTEENFDQTSAYMNHLLSVHGFSSNLQFLRADKQDATRIVTAFYKLLQQHLKDTEYKDEMDLNWRRLSQDYDTTVQNLGTTNSQLEKTERENSILRSRITALEDELRVDTEKHRHTREELKSAKANLQYTKTQYAHEARKKEQEMNVLKDKVQKTIARNLNSTSTASPSITGGITILNPVPRSLYGKQHANDAEQLLKEVIEQQQTKEAEIVEENEHLRRTLYTVQVELEGFMKKHSTSKSTVPNLYGLPFDMVKDRIETEIRDTLTLLSNSWDHRPSLEPTISPGEIIVRDQRIDDLQRDIEKMQLELEDSTLLVQGAQRMIDNLSSGNFLAGAQNFKLNVDGSEMTLQELEEADAKIRQQREDLAKERKQFTQACLDLGKQREELQRAKQDFEESKRTFCLDKVVSFLSFSPISETGSVQQEPPLPANSNAQVSESNPKKRMATSPPPSFRTFLHGRSVRPKTATSVIDVQDEGEPSREQEHSRHEEQHDLNEREEEEEEEEVLSRSFSKAKTQHFGKTTTSSTLSAFAKKPPTTVGTQPQKTATSGSRLGQTYGSSEVTTPSYTSNLKSFKDPEHPSGQAKASVEEAAKVPTASSFDFDATWPSNSLFSTVVSKAKAATTSGFGFGSSIGSNAKIPSTSRLANASTSGASLFGSSSKPTTTETTGAYIFGPRAATTTLFNPQPSTFDTKLSAENTTGSVLGSGSTADVRKSTDAAKGGAISGSGTAAIFNGTSKDSAIPSGAGTRNRYPASSSSAPSSRTGSTLKSNPAGLSRTGAVGRSKTKAFATRWK
ncbi:hypothetical protein BGZ68_007890 [Mortierella alpina]|nr:hypothetical protein BGZ68_007890 [Mortierella alpina]